MSRLDYSWRAVRDILGLLGLICISISVVFLFVSGSIAIHNWHSLSHNKRGIDWLPAVYLQVSEAWLGLLLWAVSLTIYRDQMVQEA